MSLKFIDISSHNTVAEAGRADVDGVIVKTTQGTNYVNPRADQQYQLAKKSGKLLGIYHYAGGGDPVAEANYFYANSKNYFHEAVPALDWESYQNASWGQSGWGEKFVNRIHELTGVWCLLYTGLEGIRHNQSLVTKSGLWFAGYPDNRASWSLPTFNYSIAPWKTYTLWQFTSSGGVLDRNTAAVDAKGWKSIANPTGASTPKTVVSTPKPAIYSIAGKSLEQMANDVIAGKVGSGNDRVTILGKYYTGVQAIINYKLKSGSLALTNSVLKSEVLQGDYGAGDTRKKLLGSFYTSVQALINGVTRTVKKGSKVTVTKAVAYKTNTKLSVSGTYDVIELQGNRAVIGKGKAVTAAIDVRNLKLV